jgi:hypothetical protein
MIESLSGNPFFVMALGIATSLCVLGIWGLLAWAVVHIIGRHEDNRKRVGHA